MNTFDDDVFAACWPGFQATLFRWNDDATELEPISQGLLFVTTSQTAPMLVNGNELRPQAGSPGTFLAGIFYPRRAFCDLDGGAYQPPAGDILGMRIRDDLMPAFEVRAAGPGADVAAEGTLDRDGVACESRPDLDSIHHLLMHNPRATAAPGLH